MVATRPDHGPTAPHLALGRWGERIAARRYRADGYRVVATNWRGVEGEIDLIVARRGVLVVCEVKARSSGRFGSPAEAVDRRRRERLRRATLEWLQGPGRGHAGATVRFDVVAVLPGRVERIEGAF
jgi:putative endonuclease